MANRHTTDFLTRQKLGVKTNVQKPTPWERDREMLLVNVNFWSVTITGQEAPRYIRLSIVRAHDNDENMKGRR